MSAAPAMARAGVALLGVAVLTVSCTNAATRSDNDIAADPLAAVITRGTFAFTTPPPSGVVGYAYDAALVPAGSGAELAVAPAGDKTDVRLAVTGLVPDRWYGAHLHRNPCGPDPKAAGGHFQHHPDPSVSSVASTDPSYANPSNEVWLDFITNSAGAATMTTQVPWVATAGGEPNSLVIHADMTASAPGRAGTAGARVACLTLTH